MTKIFLPFTLALLFCTGCVTPKKCLDKFGQDTVKVIVPYRDTVTIAVPADSLHGEITNDSLEMLLTGRIDSLVKVSASKDLTIKFYKKASRTGARPSLQFRVDSKPDSVTKEHTGKVIAPCPPVVVVPPDEPKGFAKLWKKFEFFAAYLVLGETIALFIFWLIKRRA